jgi:hypothetical protein
MRSATLGLTALTLSACASAAGPWAVHDQTADLKAVTAQPDRVCPVVVQNGTERVLEAMVERSGEPMSLGLLAAGQSVSLGVVCADRRVHASAVVLDPGALDGSRVLRASALLDVARETHLRFTEASNVRW